MLFNLLDGDNPVWYPIKFDTVTDIIRSVATWLTLALILTFIITYIVLAARKASKKRFLRVSLITAIAYSAAIVLMSLILFFIEEELVAIVFYPLACLILAVAVSALLLICKRNTATKIISACLIGATLVATFVCLAIHFASGDAAERNWLTNDQVNSIALYFFAVLAIAVLIALAFILGKNDKSGLTTKSISYGAICIAMSFALSYLRIVKMPQGGSITVASLLPLMIYSYIFGTKKGVLAGLIYGVLQAVQDPTVLHPAQFVLDYPAAFACIGLSGVFSSCKKLEHAPQIKFALGAIVAGLGRFVMAFLSGIFAFGAFAPAGTPVVIYSLTYQSVYLFPDLAICIVLGIILFSSKSFCGVVNRLQTSTQNQTATDETISDK